MKEIFVRLDRCVGCHSCELACAVEHSRARSLFASIGETPRPRRRLYVEFIQGRKMPFLCRHCKNAPCVQACPTSALVQDPVTRIVTLRPDRCIGCWMCITVCPYGMIGQDWEQQVAVKCDRCPDRDMPACVEACPTRALVFMRREEFAQLTRQEAAKGLVQGEQTASSP